MLYVTEDGFDRYDMVNNRKSEDGAAFTIWFSGCSLKCPGCHNVQLWDRAGSLSFTPKEIVEIINDSKVEYKDIILLGGEPMEQDLIDLKELCTLLHESGKKIWLYTGRDLMEIPYPILRLLYFVKYGAFDQNKLTGGFPSSSNQKVMIRTDSGLIDITEEGIKHEN